MAMRRCGFTLIEVMVAVAIVGVLAAAGVANYGLAVQRARWDVARDVLTKIYGGAWNFYGTEDISQFPPVPATLNDWRNNFGMEDPNTPNATVTYTYAVPLGPAPQTFTITARYLPADQTQAVTQDHIFCPPCPTCAPTAGVCDWRRP